MEVINLKENVNLHVYQTDKFKDVSVFVEFLDNSDAHDQSLRNILSICLEDTCSLYDSKQAVSNLFNKMYGGRLSVNFDVRGSARIMEVKSSFVNGKYVDDSTLLSKQFKVINEFLLNPIWKSRQYPEDLLAEIKERLRQDIVSSNDRPSVFASNQADLIYGEYLGVKADNSLIDLQTITIDDVIKIYDDIINNSSVDIIVVGDVQIDEVKKLTKEYLDFNPRTITKKMVYKSNREEFVSKIYKRKINQTSLQLRYKTNKNVLDKDYPSMVIANGILGTLPTSLLFQEVREKRSLCYSINSVAYGYDGVMKISTGIDYKDIDEVKRLIQVQIDRIKNGDFEESLLETTKGMYINVYRGQFDDIKSIVFDIYRNFIINDGRTSEKMIEDIGKVSKQSIMEVFKDVELKVEYVLKQMENLDE